MADPLSAGASVVAFLGVAWWSAKAIHETLSAVKDGPRNVQRLADDVKQLQDILGRISALLVGSAHNTDLDELATLSGKCQSDLADFASKLQRLHLTPNDRRMGKLWKRLKAAIGEKDIDRMRDIIGDYILVLNIRLTLLTTAQVAMSATQSSQILDILRQMQAELHISAAAKSPVLSALQPTNQAGQSLSAQACQALDPELEDSVDRLIKLVTDRECRLDSDDADAEQLISDLQMLLDSAQQQELSGAGTPNTTDVTRAWPSEPPPNISKELRLASSLLLSAPMIAVNRNDPWTHSGQVPEGFVLQQDRKRKVIDVSNGTLTVATNSRRRIRSRLNETPTSGNIGGKDFVAQISFRPKGSNSLLSISVSRGQLHHGSISGVPRVLLSNILPHDSHVFKVAGSGTVGDLLSLFAQGQASLHDHDPLGWSLLHHAVRFNNSPMTKFLVENGLDVDEICTMNGGSAPYESNGLKSTPLHLICWKENPGFESADILLRAGADPTIDTRSYLLTVLHLRDDSMTPARDMMFKHSLYFGLSDCRDFRGYTPLLWTHLEQMSTWDTGPSHYVVQRHVQQLSFLLNKGSSVNEVDSEGCNMLHHFFCRPSHSPTFRDAWYPLRKDGWYPSGKDARYLLSYLVEKGIDVLATDGHGRSVSHLAYSHKCLDEARELGSFCGDRWDSVLDSYGHNISWFGKGYPRQAKYTRRYSRQDFEQLWEGREHRCPYWDDVDWVSPLADEGDDVAGGLQETLCVCTEHRERWRKQCSHARRDPESSSEEDSDTESEGSGSATGDDDAWSDAGDNRLRQEAHDSATTNDQDFQNTPSPGGPSGDLECSDSETHQHSYSEYDTSMGAPEHDELSHNPWDNDCS
ncbi:hypothetical protein GE09DRAFT_731908 [Coniochaeta sp. 2T2.1]|nr:hypothetical protein GE09DRAFT_731908 [Coniochaeta sp. 2T2.1]